MSLRGQRSPKRDLNEKELRRALTAKNIDSWPVSIGDFPDLICCWQGVWFPIEIKNKDARGRMSAGQKMFFELCRTRNAPCYKISEEADIDLMIMDLRSRYAARSTG